MSGFFYMDYFLSTFILSDLFLQPQQSKSLMNRSERLILRNKNIIKRYEEIEKKNINNKQLYKHSAICEMLAMEFYLSSDYIADILLKETTQPQS